MTAGLLLAALMAGAASGGTASDESNACAIPGEAIHWLADYCMASIGTDDEIAASDCIERERRVVFENDCVAKLHYKRAMCELAARYDNRAASVANCVADRSFIGRTVRNGGVGN